MQTLKKHTILHVDDDPDDLDMLMQAVQAIDNNFEIVQARDGEQGIKQLEKMKAESTLPCLIVLEINMPLMDGKRELNIIKNDRRLSEVPVVILSTSGNMMDRLFFLKENVEFITKPLNYDHLKQIALRLLNVCNN